jgi:uncharacterized membrane protein
MAHVDRKRKVEVKGKTEPAASSVERPDWVLSGLAAAGMLVAAYLTWLKLTGSGAALCVAGSGCDIVQASRYATFLWVPTALWGLVTYVAIGILAWMGLTPRNWPIAFALAAGGVGFSAYLTWLSVFDLGATCVWCLTSAVILIAMLAVLVMRRPAARNRKPAMSSARLATYGGLAAVGTVVAAAFVFAAPFSAPPGYQSALARHLADTKAVMYGAFSCSACQEQKARFGSAAKDIPYVECDPKGANPRPDLCRQAGVKAFPTWVINGQTRQGVMTLDQLAEMSKFRYEAKAAK